MDGKEMFKILDFPEDLWSMNRSEGLILIMEQLALLKLRVEKLEILPVKEEKGEMYTGKLDGSNSMKNDTLPDDKSWFGVYCEQQKEEKEKGVYTIKSSDIPFSKVDQIIELLKEISKKIPQY